MLVRIWHRLKVWRRVPLGPVSLLYRFDRSVPITRGFRLYRAVPADGAPVEKTPSQPLGLPKPRTSEHPARPPVAVLIGVGPGFGFALARRLAAEGFDLVLACRKASSLTPLIEELHAQGISAEAYGVDATDEAKIDGLFSHVEATHGTSALVVYSVQYFSPGLACEVEVAAFEAAWRHNCLGAFLVGRKAAAMMKRQGAGTVVFVGSTSSIIGRADHLNLAVGKFGQRALAQVMARELWPHGIHVAHLMIDADIQDDEARPDERTQARPEDIAHSILHLHRQPQSAWTSEMDLRPWNERFWEHC